MMGKPNFSDEFKRDAVVQIRPCRQKSSAHSAGPARPPKRTSRSLVAPGGSPVWARVVLITPLPSKRLLRASPPQR